MIQFFDSDEEMQIIEAIRAAESNTSGEIRVHLEKNPKLEAILEAKRVFRKLKMHQTVNRNGVLILIAPEKKTFAILGDKGINDVVPTNFWEEERDLMQHHFRKGAFCTGLVAVIGQIGEKLKGHFPSETTNKNELPDDISYGEE